LHIHCGSLGDNSGSDYILYRGSKERLETLRMRKRKNNLQESISMKMIKRVYNTVFTPLTSIDLARIELEESRKAFLEAKTHTEFYAAQVEFESIRIKRLEEYVNEKRVK